MLFKQMPVAPWILTKIFAVTSAFGVVPDADILSVLSWLARSP